MAENMIKSALLQNNGTSYNDQPNIEELLRREHAVIVTLPQITLFDLLTGSIPHLPSLQSATWHCLHPHRTSVALAVGLAFSLISPSIQSIHAGRC